MLDSAISGGKNKIKSNLVLWKMLRSSDLEKEKEKEKIGWKIVM